MTNPPSQYELPPAIRRLLDAVRGRIRTYVWLQGTALVVLCIGLAFWIGLALDRFFEPTASVRQAGIVLMIFAIVLVAYRFIFRRALVSIPDASAAALLERRFPELNEQLLTAVDVANRCDEARECHPQLVHETQQSAVRAIANIRPNELFNRGPLLKACSGAAIALVSIGVFAIASREAFSFYLERLALSEKPWPRRVHLEVAGFPTDESGRRVAKLARDDDFELVVNASASGFEVPDEVEIRFRLADGRRGRDTMIRVGEAVASRDSHQMFRYAFKRVSADMEFDVVGGDDRVNNLRLQVVERPELLAIELDCVYPEYLSRETRRLPVTGGMRIPEGTRLVLHAKCTKPLTKAQIHRTSADAAADVSLAFDQGPQQELRWQYGTLTKDDALLVTIIDTDGVASREPYRISLATVRDELPQVAVRLSGIGTAITPEAVLPFVGKITDDYGVDRVWYEYQTDNGPSEIRPLTQFDEPVPNIESGSAAGIESLGQFDLRASDPASESAKGPALQLKPGQKLTISLKAADRFDLSEEPRAGSSQKFQLDVVTAADLLALMERRELALRQRYEAIYEKMVDTRNLLARVNEAPPTGELPAADQAGAEEGASEVPGAASQRELARRRLRVAGSLQNVEQSADEVSGVADAFDDLGEELTNNRIDNPDLQNRLREQIAKPLHQIGKDKMPQLAAQLELVEEQVAKPDADVVALTSALARTDEILVEMKQVLDRMLELETYNEVITLLRDIIVDQEELQRRTQERQKERLRSLLEE